MARAWVGAEVGTDVGTDGMFGHVIGTDGGTCATGTSEVDNTGVSTGAAAGRAAATATLAGFTTEAGPWLSETADVDDAAEATEAVEPAICDADSALSMTLSVSFPLVDAAELTGSESATAPRGSLR